MKTLTIDAETKDPYIGEGLGAGWCYPGDKFKVLGLSIKYDDKETSYVMPEDLPEICADYIIMHNASYDLGCLIRLGAETRHLNIIDTEVMGRLFDSSLMSYALDNLAKKYLNHKKDNAALVEAIREAELVPYTQKHHALLTKYCKTDDEEVKAELRKEIDKSDKLWETRALKWAKENMDLMQEHCYEAVEQYANMDVDLTYTLFKYYLDNCESRGWDRQEFLNLTVKYSNVSKITTSYRQRGVRVDLKRCREIIQELRPMIASLYDEVYTLAGEQFNLKSPIDMPRIFDKLGIDYPKTDAGNASITSPWMENQDHPICKAIVKARKYKNINDNFIQKILDMQPWTLGKSQEEVDRLEYGMVYPELNLLRARTGRFSCSGPNLQNIPSRDDYLAPLCRSIFIAFEDEKIYSLDYCYSDDTEVLTSSGFKLFKDVTYADKLAQYHPNTSISYATPLDLISIPYSGVMYNQKGRHVDLLVSPNHDLELLSPSGELIKRKAKEGLPKGYKNIHAGVVEGTIDEDMRLQAAIDADGSIKKGLCTFYLKKERKVSRLISLLKEFNIDFTHKTDLPSKPDYHAIYFRYETKNLPDYILNLTYQRRKQLLDELKYWDGDQHSYFTAVESKAKLIQELAITTGYRASISTGLGGYSGSTIYIVNFTNKDTTYTCKNTYEETQYEGNIYCATMPYGNLIVRRNNKVVVSGNCNQEGRLQIHYAYLLKCEGAGLLIEEFKNDPRFDMHQKVADMVGVTRSEAKAINLGISYGMGVAKLAKQLDIDSDSAYELRQRYNDLAPFLNQLNQTCIDTMKRRGFIKTLGGRRSSADQPIYKNGEKITFEYKALNKLIQGSAADQTIEAMIQAYEANIPVLFPVHDQFLISGTKEQAENLKKIMESAILLEIPVVVDMEPEGGFRWSEAGH